LSASLSSHKPPPVARASSFFIEKHALMVMKRRGKPGGLVPIEAAGFEVLERIIVGEG